jgi:hypothetical protein
MTKAEIRNDKLRAAHDKLQEAVADIVSGDDWQRMLKVASKFHKYSFNNQLMIFLQRPDATHVAGYNRWKSLGRTVCRGEKGIAIFAPCRYRHKDESSQQSHSPTTDLGSSSDSESSKPQHVIRGFRLVHVFDISQTEGEELPDLDAVRPKLLDGDAPEGIWQALVSQANDAGYEVIRDRKGSENGYCDFLEKRIAVRPDVSEAQAVKTLVHELAHALLHSDERPKSAEIAEIEVESVAYIVCSAIGLDTGAYSFPYVTRWADGNVEVVKAAAQRAINCAKMILQRLETATFAT